MKSLIEHLRPALVSTFVLAAVTCGVYPLAVTVVAQTAFNDKANGSLLRDHDGKILGSSLLGQNFTNERYFHPRPSAAGNGYDGASSSGSNLGPTSLKLRDQIQERLKVYRAENGLTENAEVPADAVTASGSGLDPHISVKNAELQTARVAKARGLSEERVSELISSCTDSADFVLLGEAGVNVLRLNLALDAAGK